MKNSELIGQTVEYQGSDGNTYRGRVLDKVRITNSRDHEFFELYLIAMPNGRVYRVSPMAIKQILT